MSISLDKAFGLHAQGMIIRAKRAEVLAGNIANADTPHYKARDIDFRQALENARRQQGASGMATTHPKHFSLQSAVQSELKYRVPMQPDTGDGNTVDLQQERNKYLENAMEYRASLTFLNGRISGLKKALTGGQR